MVGNRLLQRIPLSGDTGGKVIIFAVAAFCCLFAPTGCGKGGKQSPEPLPVEEFRDGDLAFRRGMGLTSRAVLAADRRGAYSHVGILKQLDGTWCVIHATPCGCIEPSWSNTYTKGKALICRRVGGAGSTSPFSTGSTCCRMTLRRTKGSE